MCNVSIYIYISYRTADDRFLACNPPTPPPSRSMPCPSDQHCKHPRRYNLQQNPRNAVRLYRLGWNRHSFDFSFSIPPSSLPFRRRRAGADLGISLAAEGAWAVGADWSSRSPPALAPPRVLSSSPPVAHLWRHRREGFHLPQAVGASGAVEVGCLESFLGLEGGDLGVAHLGLH